MVTTKYKCVHALTLEKLVENLKSRFILMSQQQVDSFIDNGKAVRSNNAENEKGNRLGLMLCIELLEKHRKKLKVDSKPGRGSTFSFSLPLAEE